MSGGGSTTIITTTTTSCQKRNSRFKRFLNKHCHLVDFLSASATICLCLIILLPRVHESFLHDEHEEFNQAGGDLATPSKNLAADSNHINLNSSDSNDLNDGDEEAKEVDDVVMVEPVKAAHNHEHRFPAGEMLICIGFFVFYCAGLGLARPQVTGAQQQQLYLARRRRKQSTSCCTSSRCPPAAAISPSWLATQQVVVVAPQQQQHHDELTSILSADESSLQQQADNDCLMLLNRHHQHHTHNKHHEHAHIASPIDINSSNHNNITSTNQLKQCRSNYGSTKTLAATTTQYGQQMQDECDNVTTTTPRVFVVDEIRITSGPELQRDQWPHSLRMLLFTVILALVLIFFDMNVLGMIRAVKVFRATSTGALLYVAFFIMLPQKPANCNSCKEEQEEEVGCEEDELGHGNQSAK